MKQLILGDISVSVMLTRKKVKNINIRITADGIVKISAPYRTTEKYIEELIKKRSDFILGAVYKARNASEKRIEESLKGVRYLGRLCSVCVTEGSVEAVSFDDKSGTFNVTLAPSDNPHEDAMSAVNSYITKSAETLFSSVNAEVHKLCLSRGYNVTLAKIRIKDMKSRWGSLNPRTGRLSISTGLMRYPAECVTAVFCHEYAHFMVSDHSKRFYAVLYNIYPDYPAVHRLLRDEPT